MYVSRVLSYMDGWEHLNASKPDAIEDIRYALENITSVNLNDRHISGTVYPDYEVSSLLDPEPLQRCLSYFLREKSWKPSESKEGLGLDIKSENVKDMVSIDLFCQSISGNFPSWLTLVAPRLNKLKIAEVSIVLVPEDEIIDLFVSPEVLGFGFSMSSCLVQISQLEPLQTFSPLVILGFSNRELTREISVEVISTDEEAFLGQSTIERSIEFAPEHYQAGIGILSYFGEVLKAKHPETKANIRIDQSDGIVRLHIHFPNGDKEIIERTLQQYSLVVAEKAPAKSLFDDKLKIMALENKLEMAQMEIRQNRKLFALSHYSNAKHIRTLKEEVGFMKKILGDQLGQAEKSQLLLSQTIATNDRLANVCIDQNTKLIDNLITQGSLSENVVSALQKLKCMLEVGVVDSDEEEVKKNLIVIRDNSPEILPELANAINNTIYGVSGNIVFLWLTSITSMVS